MVLNYIWIGFFVVAFIIALIKVIFLGDTEIFTAIMNSTFDSSKTAFEISLGLTGVLALWLGIMKVGENSGLINALARFLRDRKSTRLNSSHRSLSRMPSSA